MNSNPDLAAAALALLASYLMALAGLEKRGLHRRHSPRVCPSCRHDQRDCLCRTRKRRWRTRHFGLL